MLKRTAFLCRYAAFILRAAWASLILPLSRRATACLFSSLANSLTALTMTLALVFFSTLAFDVVNLTVAVFAVRTITTTRRAGGAVVVRTVGVFAAAALLAGLLCAYQVLPSLELAERSARREIGVEPEVPESMKGLDEKKPSFFELSADYDEFKEFLFRLS